MKGPPVSEIGETVSSEELPVHARQHLVQAEAPLVTGHRILQVACSTQTGSRSTLRS